MEQFTWKCYGFIFLSGQPTALENNRNAWSDWTQHHSPSEGQGEETRGTEWRLGSGKHSCSIMYRQTMKSQQNMHSHHFRCTTPWHAERVLPPLPPPTPPPPSAEVSLRQWAHEQVNCMVRQLTDVWHVHDKPQPRPLFQRGCIVHTWFVRFFLGSFPCIE